MWVSPFRAEVKMHVVSEPHEATETGLEALYRDSIWLVARATSPEIVLKYEPSTLCDPRKEANQ